MQLTCTRSCDGMRADMAYDVAEIPEHPGHYMARRPGGRWPKPNGPRFGFHLEDAFQNLTSSRRPGPKSCGYSLETEEIYGIQIYRAELAGNARRRLLLASSLYASQILLAIDFRKRLCDGSPLAFVVGVSFFKLCQLGSTQPVNRAIQRLIRAASLSPRRIGYWGICWWKPLP